VLYFEGEGTQDHRILRATKNRFGGVDEIGVFRMSQEGLAPVDNPSALFVGPRDSDSSGTAVAALLEGTRPLLVEIQALAAKAGFGTPQRVANGFDGRRLAMLLAVLEKRAGIPFGQLDVFVNVAGGLRIVEPAGDLAVAAALASSIHDRPLPSGAVFIGEVGLGGEIRPVSQTDRRVAEAERMGLSAAYLAERGAPRRNGRGIRSIAVPSVAVLLERLLS
jgi:DNA repair protein RadA/Sms